MKKTLTCLMLVAFFYSAKAQSFEIGARYFAESSWLFNSNVTNSGGAPAYVSQEYDAAYSYKLDLHLAYNFNEHTSIEGDAQFASLSQNYSGDFEQNSGMLVEPNNQLYYAGEGYKSTTTLNEIQIPVFFRFLSGNGAYFGLGPELDLLQSANYSVTYKGGPVNSLSYSVANYFTKSNVDAILTFGNNIRLTHSLFFNINLRLSYDITDIKGVDGLGQNIKDNALYSGPQQFYGSYQATNAVAASFGVGIIYRIGHDF